MKIIIVLLALTTLGAQVHAKCDSTMKTVLNCRSTPKAGDNDIAGKIVEKIDVCMRGTATYLVLEAEGSGPAPELTKPSVRAGATVYPIEAVGASLTVGTRPFPKNVRMGRLYIRWGNESISSTFTCSKK